MKEGPYHRLRPYGLCFAHNQYFRRCYPGPLSQKKVGTICKYLLLTVAYLLAEVRKVTMNRKRVLEPVDLMVAAGIMALVTTCGHNCERLMALQLSTSDHECKPIPGLRGDP